MISGPCRNIVAERKSDSRVGVPHVVDDIQSLSP